jgi:hypothetical protein
MARLKLKRIASDAKAKFIETDNGGYVLGTGQPSKFDIYDTKQEQALKGIYSSEDFQVRNASHNPVVDSQYETDFNVQGAEGDYVSLVQGRNFAIGLKRETLSGIANWNELCGYYELEPELIPIYDKNDGVFDQTYFDNLSSPRLLLSALPYAYLSEIPLDKVSYDFDNGTLYADTISMKNPYDHKYDISLSDEYGDEYVDINSQQLISGLIPWNNNRESFATLYVDDTTLIAGAPTYDTIGGLIARGRAYVFSKVSNSWVISQELSTSMGQFAFFGTNIDHVSGHIAIAGITETTSAGSFTGAVGMYELSAGEWYEKQVITTSQNVAPGFDFDRYGSPVHFYDSTTMFVGAQNDELSGTSSTSENGLVFVYDYNGTSWVESQILTGSLTHPDSNFGCSIASAGSRVFIGAKGETVGGKSRAGAVYEFQYNGGSGNWEEENRFDADDGPTSPQARVNGEFGFSLATFGTGTAVQVGSPGGSESGSGTARGVVYEMRYFGSNWIKLFQVNDFGVSGAHNIGTRLAQSEDGNTLLVSAPLSDSDGLTDNGAIFHLTRSGTNENFSTFDFTNATAFIIRGEADDDQISFPKINSTQIFYSSSNRDHSGIVDLGITYAYDYSNWGDPLTKKINLLDTRKYEKIGVDKFDAWVSYKTQNNFVAQLDVTAQEFITPLDALSPNSDSFSQYEQIERIKGFNRLRGVQSQHKSNIYSVRIKNTNLNEAIEDEQLREDVHTAIENAIREVIPKIAPANTQLWKIEWQGL